MIHQWLRIKYRDAACKSEKVKACQLVDYIKFLLHSPLCSVYKMFAKQSLQKMLSMSGSVRTQVLRQSVTMASRPAVMAAASNRAFSDSLTDGAQKLKRALDKEIKYENENYAQLEDIETFLNESGFSFDEESDGIFMSLKKQVGSKIVEVTFEAR